MGTGGHQKSAHPARGWAPGAALLQPVLLQPSECRRIYCFCFGGMRSEAWVTPGSAQESFLVVLCGRGTPEEMLETQSGLVTLKASALPSVLLL